KALLHGLSPSPSQDREYRKELTSIIERDGVTKLHDMLSEIDPEGAMTLHPNDKTRLIRALEIYHLTGKTSSEFYREHGFSERRYEALKIGLNCDRKELYARIDERVDRMVENGLVDEVKGLLEKWPHESQPFMAVGYREILSYLKGDLTLERAVYLTKLNSRHFAKRQLTWFRADKNVEWFIPDQIDEMSNEIKRFVL
ncbi:MAG: tRNA (adenosine(37)-N6)-dimethylallyltransferase MiaA, partial [Pseudomonadota bacterium]